MSTTTTIAEKVYAGPWRSQYRVNVETMAVNLATSYTYRSAPEYPDDVPAEFATVLGTWSDMNLPDSDVEPSDGSINGFWLARWNELTDDQLHAVIERAVVILNDERMDPYEMFDGQF